MSAESPLASSASVLPTEARSVARAAARRRSVPQWAVALGLLLVLALVPLVNSQAVTLNFFLLAMVYALLGLGWNIIGGYAGQPALGNAIFFGIGAYASVLMLSALRLTPWLGLLVGMALAAACAGLIGWATFRLRGHYFAIATVALCEVVRQVANVTEPIGSAPGLTVSLAPESLLAFQFDSRVPYYYIGLTFVAVVLGGTYLLERLPIGYYLHAIRLDQEAATSLGVDVTRYKLIAYAWAAAISAAAGAFYAQYVQFISPDTTLSLAFSIQAVLVAALGGMGTALGPLLGALVLIFLGEVTRIGMGGGRVPIDLVVYGVLVVLVAVFEPRGLMAVGRRLAARLGLVS